MKLFPHFLWFVDFWLGSLTHNQFVFLPLVLTPFWNTSMISMSDTSTTRADSTGETLSTTESTAASTSSHPQATGRFWICLFTFLTHWALDHIKMWSDTIILLKILTYTCMNQKKEKNILHKMSPHLSQLNVAMAHWNYFRRILKLATYTKIEDHYSRCKLATF